jgi:hypothetical protein
MIKEYKRLRALGWKAELALEAARNLSIWEFARAAGLVKLEVAEDTSSTMDDLKGETFCPKVNPGIHPDRLKHEEQCFERRVEQDGVSGLVGKYWDGRRWVIADSCWGFVGDDWKDSGYDQDIRAATLAAQAEARLL